MDNIITQNLIAATIFVVCLLILFAAAALVVLAFMRLEKLISKVISNVYIKIILATFILAWNFAVAFGLLGIPLTKGVK